MTGQSSKYIKTKKVVIAYCGDFSLTQRAIDWLREHSKKDYGIDSLYSAIERDYDWQRNNKTRHDPLLVRMVEELGEEASVPGNKLKIIEIPDDVEYTIESLNLEGNEYIAEKHRVWGK